MTETSTIPPPPARAVLVDDNATLQIAVFSGAERVAVAELEPRRALQLAGELLQAALRHDR